MKEYIERAQLLKNLGYDETRRADVLPGSTFDIVLKEPAADVAEVRHGRWEFLGPNRLVYSPDACFGFLLGRKLRLLDDLFVCSWCRRRSRKRDEKESPRRGGRK